MASPKSTFIPCDGAEQQCSQTAGISSESVAKSLFPTSTTDSCHRTNLIPSHLPPVPLHPPPCLHRNRPLAHLRPLPNLIHTLLTYPDPTSHRHPHAPPPRLRPPLPPPNYNPRPDPLRKSLLPLPTPPQRAARPPLLALLLLHQRHARGCRLEARDAGAENTG